MGNAGNSYAKRSSSTWKGLAGKGADGKNRNYSDRVWTDEYVTTRLGISFRVTSTTISNVIVRLAIGEDNSYLYALRLEAETLDHLGALATILDGIVPIDPRPVQSVMDHWAP